jgi:hypothetical protein
MKGAQGTIRELCRYDTGSGTTVLRAFEQDTITHPRYLAALDAVVVNHTDKEPFVLIDVQTGEMKRGNVAGRIKPAGAMAGRQFVTAQAAKGESPKGYFTLNREGALIPEPWIDADCRLLGTSADDRLIALRRHSIDGTATGTYRLEISILDGTVASTTKLAELTDSRTGPSSLGKLPALDSSGQVLLIETDDERAGSGKNLFWRLDLKTGNLQKIDMPFTATRSIRTIGDHCFLAHVHQDFWKINLKEGTTKKILSY